MTFSGGEIAKAFVTIEVDQKTTERNVETAAKAAGELFEETLGETDVSVNLDTAALRSEAERAASIIDSTLSDETVSVGLDTAGLTRAANAAGDALENAFEEGTGAAKNSLTQLSAAAERSLKNIEGDVSQLREGFGGGLTKAIGVVGTALSAVGAGVFLKGAIDQAAELEDSVNAVNVILGKEAGPAFQKFAEGAVSNLGLTQSALNQAVVPLGALLKNAGLAGEELSGGLADLATRANDVASVFGTDVNTVLAAFTSGVKGEFDPLEQFGVSLNAAAIEAKALSLGLVDSSGAATDAGKKQAALALIMEQTASATGDFQNTADSLPNTMRIFTATIETLQGSLAKALLPVLSTLANTFIKLLPVIQPVIELLGNTLASVFEQLGPAIGPVFDALAESLVAIAPVLPPLAISFAKLLVALAPLLPLLVELLVTAIAPLLNLLVPLATVLAPIITIFAKLVDATGPLIPILGALLVVFTPIGPTVGIVTALLVTLGAVFTGLTVAVRAILRNLDLFGTAMDFIVDVGKTVVKFFSKNWKKLLALIAAPFIAVPAIVIVLLRKFGDDVLDFFKALPGLIVKTLVALPKLLGDAFGLAFKAVLKVIEVYIETILTIFVLLPIRIAQALIALGPKLVEVFTAAFSALVAFVQSAITNLVSFFVALPGRIIGALGALGSGLVNIFTSAFAAVQAFIPAAINGIVNFFTGLPGRIAGAIGNVGGAIIGAFGNLLSVGRDLGGKLLQGFVDGLKAVPGAVGDIAKTIGGAVVNFFNDKVIRPLRDFEVNVGPIHVKPFKSLFDLLPFQEGGVFTPKVGPALLHGPEAILPLKRPELWPGIMQEAARYVPARPSAAAATASSGPARAGGKVVTNSYKIDQHITPAASVDANAIADLAARKLLAAVR